MWTIVVVQLPTMTVAVAGMFARQMICERVALVPIVVALVGLQLVVPQHQDSLNRECWRSRTRTVVQIALAFPDALAFREPPTRVHSNFGVLEGVCRVDACHVDTCRVDTCHVDAWHVAWDDQEMPAGLAQIVAAEDYFHVLQTRTRDRLDTCVLVLTNLEGIDGA